MAAYKYSYGAFSGMFKNSAEVAGKVLTQLKESETGLTPESLVDASRDENAPLHNEFEWNDNIAAEKYRREQARCIIRHLIIEEIKLPAPKHVKDRAFVYTGNVKTGYVSLTEALENKTWRKNLLDAARRDMHYFIDKYDRLEELTNVIEPMKQILSQKDAG